MFSSAVTVDKDMDGRLTDEVIMQNLRGQTARRNIPFVVTETLPALHLLVHIVLELICCRIVFPGQA